jgi:hypothetical protein
MVGFPNRNMARNVNSIFQLKVALKMSRPQIWRRVLVPSNIPMDELHLVFQAALGWTNSHLHSFKIDSLEYSLSYEPGDLTDLKMLDEYRIPLDSLINKVGTKFEYTYDFGDDWQHTVTFEKRLDVNPDLKYPLCIDGKMACPPEDVGGTYGFAQFRRIMRNPQHREYAEYIDWVGYVFDPERCDFSRFAKDLKKLRQQAAIERYLG